MRRSSAACRGLAACSNGQGVDALGVTIAVVAVDFVVVPVA
jgi:hypothetical protein